MVYPLSPFPVSTIVPYTHSLIAGQSFNIHLMDLMMGFTETSKNTVYMSIMIIDITGPKGEELALVGDTFLIDVISMYSLFSSWLSCCWPFNRL